MRAARVFISCGQRCDREKEIGFKVDRYFRDRGFETFFAEKAHSPEALTEYIFKHLGESEYFLFIDFERELLTKDEYRGSLFVNQEIAIATYLKIPGLGFYERKVRREGILNYQIYNALPFSTGGEILERLDALTEKWDADSVNELWLSPGTVSWNYVILNQPSSPHSDWWHIEVHNRHNSKHALSCLAYLSTITNIATDEPIEVPSIELRWVGFEDYSVVILANRKREFDAFFTLHGDEHIYFNTRKTTTTNPRYMMPVLEKGIYKLEYLVAAGNFGLANRTFILDFRGTLESIKFNPEEPNSNI